MQRSSRAERNLFHKIMTVCGASIRSKKVCLAWSFVCFVLLLTAQLGKGHERTQHQDVHVRAWGMRGGSWQGSRVGCRHGLIEGSVAAARRAPQLQHRPGVTFTPRSVSWNAA